MHAVQALAVLAFAGQTLAAPWNWGNGFWHGGNGNSGSNVATDVAVVTAYTTVTIGGGNFGGYSKPTATAAPQQPQQPQQPQPTASAQPTSAPSVPSTNSGYMGVVDTWRSKMGLGALSQDSKLEGNALKTAQDGNGEMVHELNPGTFAQVLAPGSADEFEHVFVGGWLCEMPSLPGLDGICGSQSQGWSYGGQTGHAEILSSTSYSKIGCALADGIWACDLA